ncbi:MAG: glycosyltransferase [Sulfurovum sp.]|nr:glycosyltransferase [Sulfurovum sp.]
MKKRLTEFIKKLIKEHYFIKNYFNTEYEKNVLISYIIAPFIYKKEYLAHTNFVEAKKMAEIFKSLKYNVDIINYDSNKIINYKKYQLIIGFGEPMEKSFYSNHRLKSIFYSTGSHVCKQNYSSTSRIMEVYHKKGIKLPESARITEKTWSMQTSLSDAIIGFGNSTVFSTYEQYCSNPIFKVPVTYLDVIKREKIENILKFKKYEVAKKHFIFFSGPGLIHKGLDLLLEVFSNNPDLHLHICADVDKEGGFTKTYYNELFNHENIHTYGFLSLQSDTVYKLIQKCAYVILPSCSEGEASSAINMMANGLLPIVTDESGIDLKDFGIRIESLLHKDILMAIKEASNLESKEIRKRSLNCFVDTRNSNSLLAYEASLTEALNEILQKETL